jgi:Sec-independent protein translocase protein TatA
MMMMVVVVVVVVLMGVKVVAEAISSVGWRARKVPRGRI